VPLFRNASLLHPEKPHRSWKPLRHSRHQGRRPDRYHWPFATTAANGRNGVDIRPSPGRARTTRLRR